MSSIRYIQRKNCIFFRRVFKIMFMLCKYVNSEMGLWKHFCKFGSSTKIVIFLFIERFAIFYACNVKRQGWTDILRRNQSELISIVFFISFNVSMHMTIVYVSYQFDCVQMTGSKIPINWFFSSSKSTQENGHEYWTLRRIMGAKYSFSWSLSMQTPTLHPSTLY